MKLFYRVYGDGPPLIILHGLYGSSDNWIPVARELQKDFKVILPDMRNHGRSPWSDIHSYAEMSQDISELMSDLGLSRIYLAGHSMGGKTAVRFVIDHPEKVYGLFIGDISPFAYPEENQIYEQHSNILNIMCSVDPGTFTSRKKIEEYLTAVAGEKTTQLVFLKNLSTEKGRMKWKLNVKVLSAHLKDFSEGIGETSDTDKKLDDIPVILLKGERSPYVTESDLNKIKILFPRTQVRIAENCGHWIHSNCPEAVVKAIKGLLVSGTGNNCLTT
jgi:esterase